MPKNKGKQAGKKTQLSNANLKGGLARTRRVERPAIGPQFNTGAMRRINQRLSWPADDCTTVHVRFTRGATAAANPIGSLAFAFDTTSIVSSGYTSLGANSPLVLAMGGAYSRFMVTKCMVKATLVTPVTNGGFIGVGYTPDNTNVSGAPSNIQDATSAVHSDMSQVGESAIINFDPSDYFVDWRPTRITGLSYPDNQCGVVQVYSDAGSSVDNKMILEVDCLVHFAGYRYNP
nr:hypothetical protein [Tolivirales sp.]WRQ65912.1 hypothetical protein [Tolivirales sp.]